MPPLTLDLVAVLLVAAIVALHAAIAPPELHYAAAVRALELRCDAREIKINHYFFYKIKYIG